MTILASGHNLIVCGAVPHIHRVKGWRLPSECVPYVGVPYEDCPTAVLKRYRRWMTGPDRWLGHVFELWAIDDVLDARAAHGQEQGPEKGQDQRDSSAQPELLNGESPANVE